MTISEVSKKFNISPDTLRYYEKIGLLPKVQKTPGGIRDYQQVDQDRIKFIKCMRQAGLSINVLIEYFQLLNQGESTVEKRKELLEGQKVRLGEKIAEMQQTLELLEYKISKYKSIIQDYEKKLVSKTDN